MEENEVIREIEHDDNCFWSYVGSFLGALVGTIPWILLYYWYSFNLALLPVLIPIASVSGYKFFKGIVNHKTFRTIVIISIAVFIIALSILFPWSISQKEKIDFNEVKNTQSYKEYSEKVLNKVGGELVAISIGLLFAYAEISKLLKRYEATNNMIKDMNTFIRKDNNPIDENSFSNGGIQFTDKAENPINVLENRTTNNINDASSKQIDNNVWDSPKRLNTNIPQMDEIKKVRAVSILIIIIVFLMPVIIMFVQILFSVRNESPSIITTKMEPIDYLDDYWYEKNGYENDYYTLGNIEFKIPYNWAVFKESDDECIYFKDEDEEMKVLIITEKPNDNYSLEEYHYSILKTNVDTDRNFYAFPVDLNGNSAYYSTVYNNENKYSVLYTMEYEENIIILFDYSAKYYNIFEYEELLNSIKKVQ